MQYIDPKLLAGVYGGMRWQDFRPSTNVEDRRTRAQIERDNRWWREQEKR